jgi:hypothetical protein
LERYTGSESEALRELAEHLTALDAALKKNSEQIKDLALAASGILRKAANIRPDGFEVNWTVGSREGSGMSQAAPSTLYNILTQGYTAKSFR